MSGASPLVWAGAAAGVTGIALLRHAWGLPRRSASANGAAWALLIGGGALALAGNGAWGLAVASLFAMGAAALVLARAAMLAPAGKARALDRRVHMLPDAGEPRRIGGRLLTFAIIVPLALAVSLAVSLGLRALADGVGWAEADSNALTLLLLPLIWSLLAFALLMVPRRATQAMLLAVPAVAGLGMVWLGSMA